MLLINMVRVIIIEKLLVYVKLNKNLNFNLYKTLLKIHYCHQPKQNKDESILFYVVGF